MEISEIDDEVTTFARPTAAVPVPESIPVLGVVVGLERGVLTDKLRPRNPAGDVDVEEAVVDEEGGLRLRRVFLCSLRVSSFVVVLARGLAVVGGWRSINTIFKVYMYGGHTESESEK